MEKTTLYKKDSKDKLRSITIWAWNGILYQESGLINGKKILHHKSCKPKNIGKTNATNEIEQAEVEAKALVAIKLKDGYSYSATELNESKKYKPMLAYEYKEYKHKLTMDTIAVQPKLDGIRCIATPDGLFSRKGREIDNQALRTLFERLRHNSRFYKETIFDGELYTHGDTFQEITKKVKNNKYINYHIYDIIAPKIPFYERRQTLINFFYNYDLQSFTQVETHFIKNDPTEITNKFNSFIAQGYEGMMIRNPKGLYTIDKRSTDLLKYKVFIDVALPIEDITPNDANPKHGTVWVRYNGKLQKTGAKLSHEDREELLTNKQDYIGKMAEIRYFEETEDGLMRFPVYHGIRIDK